MRRSNRAAGIFLTDQVFQRAAGSPLITGNRVRLLRDGEENYPAWIEAIAQARETIHFECYIIHEDAVGQRFAEALMAKAREGVKVRLIYDWLGGFGKTSRRFWRRLRVSGVEVRCFNPPHLSDPFEWIMRDHRKTLIVDGRVGFVTGLCVGQMWEGYPDRKIPPWRDTGVEIRGPAVADISVAFARAWARTGPPLPPDALITREAIEDEGEVALRVIATEPQTAGNMRLDQLVAVGARERLWLTDAYFAATTSYVQALIAASRDGVDVRLLVPGASDIPFVGSLSRISYRPLLEGGVRVFVWDGPMIHAKTAVADARWARVGSTNLNLASWFGNWELDVAIEDEDFASEMEEMYLDDLTQATEITLSARQRVIPASRPPERRRQRRLKPKAGSAGRVMAGALSIGKAVDAAISHQRDLGTADAQPLAFAAILLTAIAFLGMRWPRAIAIPVAIILLLIAISLAIRSYRLHRSGRKKNDPIPGQD
jgi:cardiolipin synthase